MNHMALKKGLHALMTDSQDWWPVTWRWSPWASRRAEEFEGRDRKTGKVKWTALSEKTMSPFQSLGIKWPC